MSSYSEGGTPSGLQCSRLTGAVSELKAEMGPSETIYGNGQLDHLAPARAVVVIQDERAILRGVWLAGAQTDAVLWRKQSVGRRLGSFLFMY